MNKLKEIDIKYLLVQKYLEERKESFITIEVGLGSNRRSDFVCLDKNGYLIEVEIKTSWSDYKKEKTKRPRFGIYIPNYFYFCAEGELADKIKEDIKKSDRFSYYGVYKITKKSYFYSMDYKVKIIKRAKLQGSCYKNDKLKGLQKKISRNLSYRLKTSLFEKIRNEVKIIK